MKLIDLLAHDRILIPLDVETLREATSRLGQSMASSESVEAAQQLGDLLAGTLPHDVLNVGEAFLLRVRTDSVPELRMALGVAPKPVRGERDASQEGRIVVVIAAPPRETSTYLQAVSTVGRVLGREAVVRSLLDAKGPSDILDAASLADIELPGYLMVRDILSPRTLSVQSDTTLGEAAALMAKREVRAIPVVSETQEVLGMVSHRELLRYLIPLYVKRVSTGDLRANLRPPRDASDPHDFPVRDVMDRSVMCVSEDQTLAEVATMMVNRNVERVPVVREGVLVGVLAREDVVRRVLGR